MWVRTVSKRDLVEINQLLETVWHHTYDAIYGVEKVDEITSQWHSIDALEKNLNAPGSEFLVVDDGKVIAGVAYASQIGDSKIKLHQLYVLPQFHGKGLGKMLLDEIEESFFEARQFVLEVEVQNTSAIGFYEKYGFAKSGEIENCGGPGSGIPALIYSKTRA